MKGTGDHKIRRRFEFSKSDTNDCYITRVLMSPVNQDIWIIGQKMRFHCPRTHIHTEIEELKTAANPSLNIWESPSLALNCLYPYYKLWMIKCPLKNSNFKWFDSWAWFDIRHLYVSCLCFPYDLRKVSVISIRRISHVSVISGHWFTLHPLESNLRFTNTD